MTEHIKSPYFILCEKGGDNNPYFSKQLNILYKLEIVNKLYEIESELTFIKIQLNAHHQTGFKKMDNGLELQPDFTEIERLLQLFDNLFKEKTRIENLLKNQNESHNS